MNRRWLVIALAGGVACFVLGVMASRLLSSTPAAVAPAGTVPAPRILIDPDSIQLLPDASLRLELPPGFDAGAY